MYNEQGFNYEWQCIGRRMHLHAFDNSQEKIPLFLEFAIREAIEKRGWTWHITGSSEYGIAQIRIKSTNHETKMRSHSSTIEALLTAYIQALEANQ